MTGRCACVGWRYWPMVRMSQSTDRRSRKACESSPRSSPRPTIRLDFVWTASSRPVRLAAERLGPRQDVQRTAVPGALADRLLEPLDRLEVVVEDVGARRHDRPERLIGAVEVGDQDLHAHAGTGLAQGADGVGEDVGAAVGQVVTGDARHDHVLQAQAGERLGHAPRLVLVVPRGPPGLDGAEAAGAGARVAQDHDGGRALLPALADVGAVRLLADRVEAEPAEQLLQLVVVVAGRQP